MIYLKLSVIIPTCNRHQMLKDTLESLLVGCEGVESFVECLVIDNGSRDATPEVVQAFERQAPFAVQYVYAACPGLHVGRNLGAQMAQADILAYLDDDVFVQRGWAEAVINRFESDASVALLGGPCLPRWESAPPQWLDDYWAKVHDGVVCGYLSLVDLGDDPKEISGAYVFGCNYSIRKSILFDCGGFAPDGMPTELIRYRGSGETHVAKQVNGSTDMIAFYEPLAAVLHRVPDSRLTRAYFLGVAQRIGISSAFMEFRSISQRGVFALIAQGLRKVRIGLRAALYLRRHRTLSSEANSKYMAPDELEQACLWYRSVHFLHLCFSFKLSRWAKQASYFSDDPCPYWE